MKRFYIRSAECMQIDWPWPVSVSVAWEEPSCSENGYHAQAGETAYIVTPVECYTNDKKGKKIATTLFEAREEDGDGEVVFCGIVSPEEEVEYRVYDEIAEVWDNCMPQVEALFGLYSPCQMITEPSEMFDYDFYLEDGTRVLDEPDYDFLLEDKKLKRRLAARKAVETRKRNQEARTIDGQLQKYLNGTGGEKSMEYLEKATELLFEGKKSVEDLEEKREKAVASRKRKQAATMAHTSLSYYDEMALKSRDDGDIDIVEVLEECVTKLTDMLGTIKKMVNEE